MIKLKIGDTITALRDIEENHIFFIKGKKYKIQRYITYWNGYVVRNKEGNEFFLLEKQIIKYFDYYKFERKQKIKKINELHRKR